MKISQELKNELGNAIAAYGHILRGVYLGTAVPSQFQELTKCSDEELKHKMELLKEFHKQLVVK